MRSPAVLATTFEFFCLFLGNLVAEGAFYLLYLAHMSEAAKGNVATALAYGLSLLALILILVWVVPRDEVRSAIKGSKKFWRELWLVVAAIPVILGLSAFITNWLSGPLKIENNQQDILHLTQITPLLPMLLLVAVLVPLVEETYFRGVLMNRFMKEGRPWLGVGFSVALFTLGHGFIMDTGFWYALPFSLVLALLFLWRKNIWPGVLIHMISNAAVLIATRAG